MSKHSIASNTNRTEISKKMFAILCRKNETTIYEVEIEKISSIEDPSVLWLKDEEFKARIVKPSVFADSHGPTIYYSHALYSSEEEARMALEKEMRYEMTEFQLRKKGEVMEEEDIQDAIAEVKTVFI